MSEAVSLKEFWVDLKQEAKQKAKGDADFEQMFVSVAEVYRLKVGLFFWERGGKQFAKNVSEHEQTMEGKLNDFFYICSEAEFYLDDYEDFTGNIINSKVVMQSRDFLDSLDCLGEEKIKELIKELE